MPTTSPPLLLVPFEWSPDYGTEIYRLRAKTQATAAREIERRREHGQPVPKGYTVMTDAEVRKLTEAMLDGTGTYVWTAWRVEDIMDARKCSRQEAEDWLDENFKHLQDACVQAGFEAIKNL